MPYIPQDDRAKYDETIRQLASMLNQQAPEKRKGHANYVITQLLRLSWEVTKPEGESYSNYADVIGTLECAKLEIYRRGVAPYEEKAIKKNGDLDATL